MISRLSPRPSKGWLNWSSRRVFSVCTINLILGVSTPKSDVNRLILVKVSLNVEKVYEYCVICGMKVLLIFWR